MATEIDFANIQQAPVAQQAWTPPRHVFFGPKDPTTGQMIPEPVYVRDPTDQTQNYPCIRYKLEEGKIKAAKALTQEEELALGPGWEDSPAAFGAITAPTFAQSRLAPPKLTQPK